MQAWLREFVDDPVTMSTVYAALILLGMLWAMALLTPRLRTTQAHLEALRGEMQVVNEALRMVTTALQEQAALRSPAKLNPDAPAMTDEELSAMPPIP